LNTTENKDQLMLRSLSLASIASRYFYEGDPSKAIMACKMLVKMGPLVREAKLEKGELNMPWLRIIKGAAQCESRRRDGSVRADENVDVDLPCNLIYAVLGAMTTFPSENDDRVFEALSNSLVRRVLFVTGAIDMAGCPKADRGEAVFIGRSNVGKSSLVNMVTNRKALAYISKRPGKTQQFNYFVVNDKPGKEKEIKYGDTIRGEPDRDSFYIVDLPGFGFAKVPEQLRKEWADFMREYLAQRRTLKVVFHLIDGRHGPIDEDMTIMRQVGESLPKNIAYVVVLTKADKNVKGPKKAGKVSIDVLNTVRETMRANKVGNAPVIVTSAETKQGRDDIWRYLRLAAEA
jgi:GTP-binding protein